MSMRGDDCGEIKRMWVDPDARGLKLGKRLLVALEAEARARGVRLLQLDAYRNRKRWGSIAPLVFGNARRSATIRLTR
jgi:GNAT superfamily N-acetyltransferase